MLAGTDASCQSPLPPGITGGPTARRPVCPVDIYPGHTFCKGGKEARCLFAKVLFSGCLFAKVLWIPFCKGFESTTFWQRVQNPYLFFPKQMAEAMAAHRVWKKEKN